MGTTIAAIAGDRRTTVGRWRLWLALFGALAPFALSVFWAREDASPLDAEYVSINLSALVGGVLALIGAMLLCARPGKSWTRVAVASTAAVLGCWHLADAHPTRVICYAGQPSPEISRRPGLSLRSAVPGLSHLAARLDRALAPALPPVVRDVVAAFDHTPTELGPMPGRGVTILTQTLGAVRSHAPPRWLGMHRYRITATFEHGRGHYDVDGDRGIYIWAVDAIGPATNDPAAVMGTALADLRRELADPQARYAPMLQTVGPVVAFEPMSPLRCVRDHCFARARIEMRDGEGVVRECDAVVNAQYRRGRWDAAASLHPSSPR